MLGPEWLRAEGQKEIWASQPEGQAVISAEIKLESDLRMHPDWVRPTGPNTLHIENQIVYDIQNYLGALMKFMNMHGK